MVAGRWFRGGIRTTGPSDNLCDHGSSNTHAHTGTILSIYLSFSVHHCFESPISNNYVFTYTCSFFVATGTPSSVVHVQQTSSEMVAICRYQGEVGVIDSCTGYQPRFQRENFVNQYHHHRYHDDRTVHIPSLNAIRARQWWAYICCLYF